MSTREVQVADYLRTDATLVALVPGGIYPAAWLPVPEGLTTDKLTKVWQGGVFHDCIIVRQRAPVPTGDLQSVRSQRTSMSQVVGVWAYGLTDGAIEAILSRVYTLLMGKRLAGAFSATWAGSGGGISQAPELPSGTFTQHEDYRIVKIRYAA